MMGELLQRLQDPTRSGVYRAPNRDAIADALRGSKLLLASIAFDHKDRLLKNIAPPGGSGTTTSRSTATSSSRNWQSRSWKCGRGPSRWEPGITCMQPFSTVAGSSAIHVPITSSSGW